MRERRSRQGGARSSDEETLLFAFFFWVEGVKKLHFE